MYGTTIPILLTTMEPIYINRNSHEINKPSNTEQLYWWNNPNNQIGYITKCERPIRIINTLIGKTTNMIVCEEDTILDIQEKYCKKYNFHAKSYTWRKKCCIV